MRCDLGRQPFLDFLRLLLALVKDIELADRVVLQLDDDLVSSVFWLRRRGLNLILVESFRFLGAVRRADDFLAVG